MTLPNRFPKNKWYDAIQSHPSYEQIKPLMTQIEQSYQTEPMTPSYDNLFKAFELTDLDQIKVIILGQDPYPTPGDAMGLAFSTNGDVPKSLINIYKERYTDLGIEPSTHGDLTPWAKQGVFLWNTALTTKENIRDYAKKWPWETFNHIVIDILNQQNKPLVYLLWGNNAIAYRPYIKEVNNLIIQTSHPSPLGWKKTKAPFYKSRPFSKTNQFLTFRKIDPIDWKN